MLIKTACERCGETFEAGSYKARYCSGKCRSQAFRARAKTAKSAEESSQESVTSDKPPAYPEGLIAAATRAELAAVQQDRSAVGLVAIALAQRIDAFGMVESGSGLAALADKHAAALTRALDPSKVKREAVEGELAKLIGEAGGGLVAIKGGRS